jgi:nucleotide-binding universal stress UspA family protein
MRYTVLIPLDGSSLAETALLMGQLFARAVGADLDLLQVVATNSPANAEEGAQAYLDGLAAHLGDGTLGVSTRVMRGDPAECIVREAAAEHVDLVVIATHGRAGLGRAIHGSVAEHVVAHAPAPVVVVRAGLRQQPQLQTLLLAIEPSSGAPLAATIKLAQATGARVVLLTVVPPGATLVWQWKAGELLDEPQAVVTARNDLEELATHMRIVGVAADVRVAVGPTVACIQTVASITHADLIIMNTHARTGLHRTMLGSTADGVIRTVDQAVLLVRLAKPEAGRVRPLDVYHLLHHEQPGMDKPSIAVPLDRIHHSSAPPRWRHLPQAPLGSETLDRG